jgi:hypothetical protein
MFSLKKFKWLFMGIVLAGLAVWFWPDGTLQETSLEIPVKIESLPAGLIQVGPPLKNLTVNVRGSRSALALAAERQPVYTLDLAGTEPGEHSIPVHPEQLQLPENIVVVGINVSAIHLVLDQVIQKEVPVVVAFSGNPPKGYSVTAATVVPATVMLKGPQSRLEGLTKVPTIPIEVGGAVESLKKEVALTLQDGIEIVFPKSVITAEIQIEEKVVTRKFVDIPVEGKNASYLFSITPAVIQIDVRGPVNVLDKLLDTDAFSIHVDLDGLAPGVYVRRATIALPLNTTLVGVAPEIFTVNVIKP